MTGAASARSLSARRVAAEAIGTFFLVLIGPGAAMFSDRIETA
jgi:glycerol uptake facilitator-like aquaporin